MTPKKFKPGTRDSRRDWEKYRAIFLGRDRLNLGARFWKENRATLERAKKEFGVDPAVIVGIIGVETATVKTQDPGRFWTPLLP